MHGLKQQIRAKVLPSSLSCIDLTFTDQPNLAVDGGVHPSLHPNCHHQIIYCKFNLMMEHLSWYERLAWDYKCSNQEAVASALD